MRPRRRWLLFSGALSLAALLYWAGSRGAPTPPAAPGARPGSGSGGEPPPASAARRGLPEARTLLEQPSSAYHARLFADADGALLVTPGGFTRLSAERPPEEHAVSLGPVVARQGGTLLFWRSGRLRELSLDGQGERELAPLPRPPRHLLASEGHLAWLQPAGEEGTSLETLSGGEVKVVHTSALSVSAAILRGSQVYWVAEARDGTWRIERITLDGAPPLSTVAQRGRPPAMLALGRDGVYYYDGPRRGIRRLTFDLAREVAVLPGVVCSPLSAAERVVCAQVGGLFEVTPSSPTPRLLAPERAGPITAVVATDERAYWVAENGEDRLLVRTVPLTGHPGISRERPSSERSTTNARGDSR